MDRLVVTSAWSALLAMSLGVGCSEPPKTANSSSGGGGAGGAPTGSSSSSSSGEQSSSSIASTSGPTAGATTGGSGGAGGSVAFVCDPPAEAGSIYETSGVSLNIEQVDPISMCKYRGDVMLVVNTAAI